MPILVMGGAAAVVRTAIICGGFGLPAKEGITTHPAARRQPLVLLQQRDEGRPCVAAVQPSIESAILLCCPGIDPACGLDGSLCTLQLVELMPAGALQSKQGLTTSQLCPTTAKMPDTACCYYNRCTHDCLPKHEHGHLRWTAHHSRNDAWHPITTHRAPGAKDRAVHAGLLPCGDDDCIPHRPAHRQHRRALFARPRSVAGWQSICGGVRVALADHCEPAVSAAPLQVEPCKAMAPGNEQTSNDVGMQACASGRCFPAPKRRFRPGTRLLQRIPTHPSPTRRPAGLRADYK